MSRFQLQGDGNVSIGCPVFVPVSFCISFKAVSYAGSSDLTSLAPVETLRSWPILLTLVISGSIEHAIDLQDVAVTVVSSELVPRPVEAQNQLSRPPSRLIAGVGVSHDRWSCRA